MACNPPSLASRPLLGLALAVALIGCGDSTRGGADAAPPDAARDAAGSDSGSDAGPTDAGPADAGPADAGPTDAGPTDAGADDAGRPDAGPADAGFDAGPVDAGTDAGPPDAGSDAGPADAGSPDAGPPDADGDGYTADVDCADDDPTIHPGATEVCNGVDDDCDPATGEPNGILRDGAPAAGTIGEAIAAGGLVEICGVFPLYLSDRLTNDVRVVGLTEDAGMTMESGRLDFETGVDVTLENLRITADIADGLHGIRVREATVSLTDVEIEGLQSAITATLSTVEMTRGRIAGSRESSGVYLDRSEATFDDVTFEDNETRDRDRGGGALFVSLGSTATLTGCVLHDNRNIIDGSVGGGVYMGESPSRDWGSATLTATSCDWGTGATDNSPDDLAVWFGPGTSGHIVDDVTGDIRCTANSAGNDCTAL